MRNVVLLVKNGIGFGHIRRALLVAEALHDAGRLRPILISQAGSLALYRESPVRVVNFPLLHRVPSAITEDLYLDLLDRLLTRLDPALVVEDTYPDARYRRLPALADRPRVLIMRRLDGLSLDEIRDRGDLAYYDQILIAQEKDAFRREGHSGESLAAVELSGRFTFVGEIAHRPTPEAAQTARDAYAPGDRPLVVVNGGAGGDQLADGYGDRLFEACRSVAASLAEETHPAQFVFVTGPYYAGRPLRDTENVRVRRFEPQLAALLAAADVAVIKPGNNVVAEARAGRARLILVPDASFMEGLDAHAARIATAEDAVVGAPCRDSLEPLIRDALNRPRRRQPPSPSGESLSAVVRELHRYAEGADGAAVSVKELVLVLMAPAWQEPGSLSRELPDVLQHVVIMDDPRPAAPAMRLSRLAQAHPSQPTAVMIDSDLDAWTPQDLVDRGVRILLEPPPAARRWLTLNPPRPALLAVPADQIVAEPNRPNRAQRRIARHLETHNMPVLLLDLGPLTPDEMKPYLDATATWLAAQPVRLTDLERVAAAHADRLLGRGTS